MGIPVRSVGSTHLGSPSSHHSETVDGSRSQRRKPSRCHIQPTEAWSRRLAYYLVLVPAARPPACAGWLSRTRDYVCGECRWPPNPSLIGPWPSAHPCSPLRRPHVRRRRRRRGGGRESRRRACASARRRSAGASARGQHRADG